MGETHGNGPSKSSRHWRCRRVDPFGVGGDPWGARPVGDGHKNVPLPTATQSEPLRGCNADGDKGKANDMGW
jgi:hypothetical protein